MLHCYEDYREVYLLSVVETKDFDLSNVTSWLCRPIAQPAVLSEGGVECLIHRAKVQLRTIKWKVIVITRSSSSSIDKWCSLSSKNVYHLIVKMGLEEEAFSRVSCEVGRNFRQVARLDVLAVG